MEQQVSALRVPRNETMEAYLKDRTDAKKETMKAARSEFLLWHGVSIGLNLATILCVTAAMGGYGGQSGRRRSDAW